jgi:hypothetical protein
MTMQAALHIGFFIVMCIIAIGTLSDCIDHIKIDVATRFITKPLFVAYIIFFFLFIAVFLF